MFDANAQNTTGVEDAVTETLTTWVGKPGDDLVGKVGNVNVPELVPDGTAITQAILIFPELSIS